MWHKLLGLMLALIFSVNLAIAAKIPTSTIHCYIDPSSRQITDHACAMGRCVDYSNEVCEPDDAADVAFLKFYNSRTGRLLYAAEFPCSTAKPRVLCRTYRGPAELSL